MRFDDQVFLVTGGARGIGRAVVARLVHDGARVAILDRDLGAGKDAVGEYGAHVKFIRTDVSREPAVRAAVTHAVRWGGRLDGLVNNAGLADPDVGPPERLALAVWQKFLAVNLTGYFLVAKHAIPHLRRAPGPAAMVHIGSTRARQSEPNTVAYAAAKGGIAALSHALAISCGPDIRSNCIEPGWIAVDRFGPRATRHAPKLAPSDHAQHPVGRVGRPEDIASLAAWLLSAEAGFVTGATYVSDGGMTRKMIYTP